MQDSDARPCNVYMYAYRCGRLDQDCLLHPDWTPVIFETRLGRDWQRMSTDLCTGEIRPRAVITVLQRYSMRAKQLPRCAYDAPTSAAIVGGSTRIYCKSLVQHVCIIVQKRVRYSSVNIKEQESKRDSHMACKDNIQHGAFHSRIARASSQSLRACSVSRVDQHTSRFGVGAPSRTPEVLRL